MKLVIYTIGGLAIVLFTLGIFLYILMQWGALVEYHAFEWRGVQPTMKSPLTKATANLSYWFLGTGFLTGFIALIPFFTTAIRNSRKTHKKYPKQAQDLLKDGQNQVDS